MTTESDWILAEENAEAYFTALVADHHADLIRLAYAMVGEVPLAQDVAQAAWAAAWKHRAALRDPTKTRSWLLTITANEARRALRGRRLRRWLPLASEAGAVPAAAVRDREGAIDLVAALQRLPARDRQILALRYALGETSAEIGQQVGLSDSGVRVRLGRLLAILREELSHD